MAKITQINNGDTGLQAREKMNEALKAAEVDNSTLTGAGVTGDPLKLTDSYKGQIEKNTPLKYQFSVTTTEADPGAGYFRRNAGGTELYISNTNALGDVLNTHLMKLKTGSSIHIKGMTGTGKLTATLTADAEQLTGYVKLTISDDIAYSAFTLDSLCIFDVVSVGGASITVDSALDENSTNPVENKAVYAALISSSEAAATVLTFDKFGGQFYGDQDLSAGDLNLTVAASGNLLGEIIAFKIIADGVHAVNFTGAGWSTADNAFSGIKSGDVLSSGTYWSYYMYTPDGVVVTVPAKASTGGSGIIGIGDVLLYLNAGDIDGDGTFNSAYSEGSLITTWVDKSDFNNNGASVGSGLRYSAKKNKIAFNNDVIQLTSSISVVNGSYTVVSTKNRNSDYLCGTGSASIRVIANHITVALTTTSFTVPLSVQPRDNDLLFVVFGQTGISVYRNNETSAIGSLTVSNSEIGSLQYIGNFTNTGVVGESFGFVLFNKAITEEERLTVYSEFLAQTGLQYYIDILTNDVVYQIGNVIMYFDTLANAAITPNGYIREGAPNDVARLEDAITGGNRYYEPITGQPVISGNKIVFDGVDDVLRTVTGISFPASAVDAQTFAFVLELKAINDGIMQLGNTNYMWFPTATTLHGLTASTINLGTSILQKCVLIVVSRSGGTDVYINSDVATGTIAQNPVETGFRDIGQGGGVRADMDFWHASYFNKALSAGEITTLMNALKTRHSIA